MNTKTSTEMCTKMGPKMKNDVSELLVQQIGHEFYSGYLYLDFACYFDSKGLKGFANWYHVQAMEELEHGMRFIRYLTAMDEEICLREIRQPAWTADEEKNCETIFKAALEHEQYITRLIEVIFEHAEAAHDLQTQQFLDWFIAEQMEEEKNACDMIRKFKLYGADASGLYLLDQELGKRKYTAPDADD